MAPGGDGAQVPGPFAEPRWTIDEDRPPTGIWWREDGGPATWEELNAVDDGYTTIGSGAGAADWSAAPEAFPAGPPDPTPYDTVTGDRPPMVWSAITSLVAGIIGLVFCHLVLGPVAIGYGYQARTRIRDAPPGARQGGPAATAGIALGVVAVVIGIARLATGLLAG